MSLEGIYFNFLIFWTLVAVLTFFSLFFKNAPYGRFLALNSSFTLPSRIGWVVMESPTVMGIFIFIIYFYEQLGRIEILFSFIWLAHYLHRTFIWPFRAKLKGKEMTLSVMFMALIFNVINVTLQCIWIFILGEYSDNWITSPFFLAGLFLFVLGMMININSDNILMKLRNDQGSGYHVPKGFLYKYISCPNYFGELVEWLGWALLTMSPAGFVFFIWTAANLVPRAKSNHEWSKQNISGYPSDRYSIIPFIY